jgi:hypothetical protein
MMISRPKSIGDAWRVMIQQKDKIAELEKGYEQLRIAALNAAFKMTGGKAKADLRDAYDKATEQLKALRDQG